MSVISVGGRHYAANLRWLERAGRRGTARTAARLRRYWFVHRGKRTGFAAREAATRAGDAIVLARPAPARDVWRKLRVAGVALLPAIGVWALAATGWAWMERDALLVWIAEPGARPMPPLPPLPPFDPPDFPPHPPPAAPPLADQ